MTPVTPSDRCTPCFHDGLMFQTLGKSSPMRAKMSSVHPISHLLFDDEFCHFVDGMHCMCTYARSRSVTLHMCLFWRHCLSARGFRSSCDVLLYTRSMCEKQSTCSEYSFPSSLHRPASTICRLERSVLYSANTCITPKIRQFSVFGTCGLSYFRFGSMRLPN